MMARPAPANPGTGPQHRRMRRPEKRASTMPFWDYDYKKDENYQALRALGAKVTGSKITNARVAQMLGDFCTQNRFPKATTSNPESLADLAMERGWKRSAGATARWVKDNWNSHGEKIMKFAPESFKKISERQKKEAASHDSTKQSTPLDSDQHQWDNPWDPNAISVGFDFNDGSWDCNDEPGFGFDFHFNTGFCLNHPSALDCHW